MTVFGDGRPDDYAADANIGAEVRRRFDAADRIRKQWAPVMQDCQSYALPNRENFWTANEGEVRTDLIFDATAVISTQEFASRLQAGLTPNYSKWADFTPGPDVKPADRDAARRGMQDICTFFFELLADSNFSSESNECYQDLAVGTAALLIEEGEAGDHPFNFTAIPLPHIWLEAGRDDKIDGIFRPITIPVEEISVKWPDAVLPPKLATLLADKPRTPVNLIEATLRDVTRKDTTAWRYRVVEWGEQDAVVTRDFEGDGSCPWVVFRWSKAAGETWGRGALMNALPDIKTTNMIVQILLENAEMAVSGIWQYEDDGVIDPNAIDLVPGTMIPHGANSKGLEPLNPPGKVDFAQLLLTELRANIKRALFDELLGPVDKTPMSATEVHARMAEMARRVGSPYGRLQYEMIQPVVKRCLFIMKKRGLIQLPKLHGRYIRIVATSPLARQQKYAVEVQAIDQLLEIAVKSFGPQMVNLFFKGPETLQMLADDLGVPQSIIRNDVERTILTQQVSQLAAAAAQQQAQAGQGQPGPPSSAPGQPVSG